MWGGIWGWRLEGGNTRDPPSSQERCEPQTTAWPANSAVPASTQTLSLSRGGQEDPPLSCCCDGTSSFPWRLLVGPPLQKPERPRGAGGGQCSCFIESMQPAHRFVKSFCTSLGGPEPWARGPFLDAINFHLGLSAACKQMSAQVWESGGGMLNGPMAPLGQACQCHH